MFLSHKMKLSINYTNEYQEHMKKPDTKEYAVYANLLSKEN